MVIPRKQLNQDLVSRLTGVSGVTFDEIVAGIIISVLTRNKGNRTHTAKELKIPLRSLRHRIRVIESMGYEVPPSLWTPRRNLDGDPDNGENEPKI